MHIKESKIRQIIREALLKEITDFGAGIRVQSEKKISECPFYTEIPAKFAKLFKSTSAQEFKGTLVSMFPGLESDLSQVGFGEKETAASGIVKNIDPTDPSDILRSNDPVQILAAYFNTYLYSIGVGCLEFYYLGETLSALGLLLGDEEAKMAGDISKDNAGITNVDFVEGINQRAKAMEKSSDSAGAFISPYAFYVFPKLSEQGANTDDTALLQEDLIVYQDKIDEIEALSDVYPDRCFSSISRILDIKRTSFFQASEGMFDQLGKNKELVEDMKKKALASLLVALGKARLSYVDAERSNPEFKRIIRDFAIKNTK